MKINLGRHQVHKQLFKTISSLIIPVRLGWDTPNLKTISRWKFAFRVRYMHFKTLNLNFISNFRPVLNNKILGRPTYFLLLARCSSPEYQFSSTLFCRICQLHPNLVCQTFWDGVLNYSLKRENAMIEAI